MEFDVEGMRWNAVDRRIRKEFYAFIMGSQVFDTNSMVNSQHTYLINITTTHYKLLHSTLRCHQPQS